MNDAKQILEFMHFSEKLKDVLRHSWTSGDRQESAAEHSWRMALLTMALAPKLDQKNKVNIEHVLKMVTIHDLVEVEAGDTPAQKVFFDKNLQKSEKENENNAILIIRDLAGEFGQMIYDLWIEYSANQTNDAKFVKAIDKLEVRIQHNESKIERIDADEKPRAFFAADKYVEYDSYLKSFFEAVKDESHILYEQAGFDLKSIYAEAEKLKKLA